MKVFIYCTRDIKKELWFHEKKVASGSANQMSQPPSHPQCFRKIKGTLSNSFHVTKISSSWKTRNPNSFGFGGVVRGLCLTNITCQYYSSSQQTQLFSTSLISSNNWPFCFWGWVSSGFSYHNFVCVFEKSAWLRENEWAEHVIFIISKASKWNYYQHNNKHMTRYDAGREVILTWLLWIFSPCLVCIDSMIFTIDIWSKCVKIYLGE